MFIAKELVVPFKFESGLLIAGSRAGKKNCCNLSSMERNNEHLNAEEVIIIQSETEDRG